MSKSLLLILSTLILSSCSMGQSHTQNKKETSSDSKMLRNSRRQKKQVKIDYIYKGKTYEKMPKDFDGYSVICEQIIVHTPEGKTVQVPLPNLQSMFAEISQVTDFFVIANWSHTDGPGSGILIDLYGENKIYDVGISLPAWSPNKKRFLVFDYKDRDQCEDLTVFAIENGKLILELQVAQTNCLPECQARQCLLNETGDLGAIKWKNDSTLVGFVGELNSVSEKVNSKEMTIQFSSTLGWKPSFKVDNQHWKEIYKKDLEKFFKK